MPYERRLTPPQARHLAADTIAQSGRDLRPGVRTEQAVTRAGCKIIWRGQGAVGSYWLTGYAADGQDIVADLDRLDMAGVV